MRFKNFKPLQEAVKLTPAELDKPNSTTGEARICLLYTSPSPRD